jgi:serine/threonine-protein kinase
MRIADYLLGHGLEHVIPIFDAGFDTDAGTNFIVMPIAQTSLQQVIASGALSEKEALEILTAIAAGLEEIGDIIHRDLKPGNVLLHEGVWKLADLGLARFAEAATSLNTMRDALTPPYAAPEQWRGERPSKATDVYALGCIMYALLQGAPPFAGPTNADYSHQHQFVAAPGLESSPHLRRLAAACLSKAPELRPSLRNLRKQLDVAAIAIDPSRATRLADAAAAVLERDSLEEERRLQVRQEEERCNRLTTEAVELLKSIFEQLEATVLREAPNARVAYPRTIHLAKSIALGDAFLDFGVPCPPLVQLKDLKDFRYHVGSSRWDVYAGGYIGVYKRQVTDVGRSANLWFGRLLEGDDYRWWEVSYVYARNDAVKLRWEPFGLEHLPGHMTHKVAADPKPVTPEFVDKFIDRWIELFGVLAASGRAVSSPLFAPNGKFRRQKVASDFNFDRG